MKRYLLFSGRCYYADGGWNDFTASFDTPQAAIVEGQRLSDTTEDYGDGFWWHVVDTEHATIVQQHDR